MQVIEGRGSEPRKRFPKGWLPRSLRKVYLLFLGGLFLFMLVIIEVLRQYSKRQGGIVHWKNEEDLSTATWGAFTYPPLITGLLAINLLDICAQDVQRLEPFFQLAKPDGAPVAVLFINYCCNGISASVAAVRNRHWIVLGVTSISFLFRMFLPSLLAGLVDVDEANLSEKIMVKTWPSLIDVDTQKYWLSAETLRQRPLGSSDLYSFSLPSPSEYATAPTSMPIDDQNKSSLLTLNQKIYWSNMTCVAGFQEGVVPRIMTHLNSTSDLPNAQESWSWSIHNVSLTNISEESTGSQCQVNIELDSRVGSEKETLQARYWEPVQSAGKLDVPSAFSTDGCGSFDVFGVIIDMRLTAKNISTSNVTVLACSTSYHQAQADVTLNSNASIADVQTVPSTIELLDPNEFYVEGIHGLIASRYLSAKHNSLLEDSSSFNSSAHGWSRVVIASNHTIIDYKEYLQQIRHFWNNNFIVTVDRFFSPAGGPTLIEAEQQTAVVILTVISNTAFFAEAILISGIILLGILACICQRRPNFLQWDPGSIAAQCALIARLFTSSSKAMLSDSSFHQATTRQLLQWSNGKWCQWVNDSGEEQIQIVDRSETPSYPSPITPPRRPDPMPQFLKMPWFLVECFLLAGILAVFGVTLAYLRWKTIYSLLNTGAAAATMMFLTYGPTATASIIGSLLVSIYRHLSAMEPWIRLQEGLATAKQSVVENYGIQTPFLPLLARHHHRPGLLFILSLVCLGDLALRTLSGGLFPPQLKSSSSPTSLLLDRYNPSTVMLQENGTDLDISLIVTSRLLNNATFLPWTSTDGSFFFLPFEINDPLDDEYTIHSATTRGIGAELQCQLISSALSWNDTVSGTTFWNYTLEDGTNPHCTVEVQRRRGHVKETGFSMQLYVPSGTDKLCQQSTIFVIASWGSGSMAYENDTDSILLHCQQKVHIEDFQVEFDSNGMIMSQKRVAGSSITSGELFQNASDILGNFNKKLTSFPRKSSSHPSSSFHLNDWLGPLAVHKYKTKFPGAIGVSSENVVTTIRSIYQTLFSSHLALWKEKLLCRLPPDSAIPAHGVTTDTLWGLWPSDGLVAIVICLISIDTIALIGVFLLRYKRYRGPRVPRSIGSLIPWVAESQMLADCGRMYDMSGTERDNYLREKDCRYRVGNFTANEQQWILDYDDSHSAAQIDLTEMRRTE